jgi:uncharacterized protein YbaP (TraB family)
VEIALADSNQAMVRMFRTLTAAFLVLSFAATPAQSAGAPALWMVQSTSAKIYIFGTIHVMKPGVTWTTPAIDQALAESSDLWLEVPDDPHDAMALLPQVQSLGLDPQHPLSTKISPGDLSQLDALFKTAGLPGEASFEPFRPWFAALMLSMVPVLRAGYSADSGIDMALRARMTDAGKPIKGFETATEQMHFLADLPQSQEVEFLHETIAEVSAKGGGEAGIEKLEAMWQSGDVDQAAKYEAKETAMDPSLIAVLVTNRNANWAKQLDERLHSNGTSFVAVGMLHLAGPGSLVDDLTKLGYTVTRLE